MYTISDVVVLNDKLDMRILMSPSEKIIISDRADVSRLFDVYIVETGILWFGWPHAFKINIARPTYFWIISLPYIHIQAENCVLHGYLTKPWFDNNRNDIIGLSQLWIINGKKYLITHGTIFPPEDLHRFIIVLTDVEQTIVEYYYAPRRIDIIKRMHLLTTVLKYKIMHPDQAKISLDTVKYFIFCSNISKCGIVPKLRVSPGFSLSFLLFCLL